MINMIGAYSASPEHTLLHIILLHYIHVDVGYIKHNVLLHYIAYINYIICNSFVHSFI